MSASASAAPLYRIFPAGSNVLFRRTQLLSLLSPYAFTDHNHHMMLKFVQLPDLLLEFVKIDRHFGDQNQIRLSVGCSQRDVARLATHDFHDRDTPVAFGGRTNAIQTLGDDEYGSGESRCCIVHDVVESDAFPDP